MSRGRPAAPAVVAVALAGALSTAGCGDDARVAPSASTSTSAAATSASASTSSPTSRTASSSPSTSTSASTATSAAEPPAAGVFTDVLGWDGRERTYRLVVPEGLDGSPVPLLVLLHGGGQDGSRVATFSGFDTVARAEGFLVVTPDGVGRNWNDGRDTDVTVAHREQVDDLGFLQALVDDLAGRLPVDRARVYAAGISNGAFMSARLGCEASGTFAAVGLVVGTAAVPVLDACAPEQPVPLVGFFGTDDPLVPYEGGEVRDLRGRPGRGAVVGAEELTDRWAVSNGCGAPTEEAQPDVDPVDGSTVTRRTWSGCENDATVDFYRIDGGGHTWPGRAQYLPVGVVGGVNRDIDATALIWAFFAAHALR